MILKTRSNYLVRYQYKSTGVQAAGPGWKDTYFIRIQGAEGDSLFLPEGQYIRMHQAGLRVLGALSTVQGEGGRGAGCEQGQRGKP